MKELTEIIDNIPCNIIVRTYYGLNNNELARDIERRSKKRMVVLSVCPVKALQNEWMTISSFFKLPNRPLRPSSYDKQGFKINELHIMDISDVSLYPIKILIENLQTIVIPDALSLRCDQLDAMDSFLRLNLDKNVPFGGVQIVLIESFYDSVPKVSIEKQEDKRLQHLYRKKSYYYFDAQIFDSTFWIEYRNSKESIKPAQYKIPEVTNEVFGKDIKLSENTESSDLLLDKLIEFQLSSENYEYCLAIHVNEDFAQFHNQKAFSKLQCYYHKAVSNGKFDHKKQLVPFKLKLAINSLVVFVDNDIKGIYRKGQVGRIVSIERKGVNIHALTVFCDGKEIEILPKKWKEYIYCYNEKSKEITKKQIGDYCQFPFLTSFGIMIDSFLAQSATGVLLTSYPITDTIIAYSPKIAGRVNFPTIFPSFDISKNISFRYKTEPKPIDWASSINLSILSKVQIWSPDESFDLGSYSNCCVIYASFDFSNKNLKSTVEKILNNDPNALGEVISWFYGTNYSLKTLTQYLGDSLLLADNPLKTYRIENPILLGLILLSLPLSEVEEDMYECLIKLSHLQNASNNAFGYFVGAAIAECLGLFDIAKLWYELSLLHKNRSFVRYNYGKLLQKKYPKQPQSAVLILNGALHCLFDKFMIDDLFYLLSEVELIARDKSNSLLKSLNMRDKEAFVGFFHHSVESFKSLNFENCHFPSPELAKTIEVIQCFLVELEGNRELLHLFHYSVGFDKQTLLGGFYIQYPWLLSNSTDYKEGTFYDDDPDFENKILEAEARNYIDYPWEDYKIDPFDTNYF